MTRNGRAGRPHEQPSLPGLEAVPRATDRLFFAIYPDVAAAARIADLAQRLRVVHDLSGRPRATDQFHITLYYLGDHVGLPKNLVAAAGTAASAVRTQPFEVAFDWVASFDRPHNRPFVLRGGDGIAALTVFQRALGTAMMEAGLASLVGSHFTPHVTLLYDDRHVAEHPVQTIGWTVREFVLVDSLLGRTRHMPLGRWPLRG